MKPSRVGDLLIKDVPQGGKETPITQVIKQMIQKKMNFFAVINDFGEIEGVVTLYDILDQIIPYFLKLDPMLGFISINEVLKPSQLKKLVGLKAESIMVRDVYYLFENDDLIKAINLMYAKNFDFIPVVDSRNKFLGVVDRLKIDEYLLEEIETSQSQ